MKLIKQHRTSLLLLFIVCVCSGSAYPLKQEQYDALVSIRELFTELQTLYQPNINGTFNFCDGSLDAIFCQQSGQSDVVFRLTLIGNGTNTFTSDIFQPLVNLTTLEITNVIAPPDFVDALVNYSETLNLQFIKCWECRIQTIPTNTTFKKITSLSLRDNPIDAIIYDTQIKNLLTLDLLTTKVEYLRGVVLLPNTTDYPNGPTYFGHLPDNLRLTLKELPELPSTSKIPGTELSITLAMSSFNITKLIGLAPILSIFKINDVRSDPIPIEFPLDFINQMKRFGTFDSSGVNFIAPTNVLNINITGPPITFGIDSAPQFNINGAFPLNLTLSSSASILKFTNMSLTVFPYNLANISTSFLYLSNNLFGGNLPIIPPRSAVDLTGNLFTGTIPDEYCNGIYFISNNSLSGILPSCYTCHLRDPYVREMIGGNQFSNYLDTWTVSQYPACTTINATLDPVAIYSSLTIRGKDLGFSPFQSATYINTINWTVGIPNAILTGSTNLIPSIISRGYLLVNITSANVLLNLTVTSSRPIIQNVSNVFPYNSLGYTFSLDGHGFGQSLATLSIKVGNYPCQPSYVYGVIVICTVFQNVIPMGYYNITVKNTLTNLTSDPFQYRFVNIYPYVTANDPCTIAGGPVILYGSFGPSPYGTNNSVSIGGINCTITLLNETQIHCNMGGPGTPGLKSVNITIHDTPWSSAATFAYRSSATDCINNCNGNGFCDRVYVTCYCYVGWTGRSCNETHASLGDGTVTNPGGGGATITNDIVFGFQIRSIREFGIDGEIAREHFFEEKWKSVNTTVPRTWKYQADFETSTTTYLIEEILEPRNTTFAGIPIFLEKGAVKLSVNITGWSYQSQLNTLQLVIRSYVDPFEECQSTSIQTVNSADTNSLNYITITHNGRQLYGRFIDKVMSDGRATFSRTQVLTLSDKELLIGINLPYCQDCSLDPDFSVLVQDSISKCDVETMKKWVVPTAVVVSVVGGAMLVAIFIIFIKKRFHISITRKGIVFFKKRSSRKDNDNNLQEL